MLVTRIRTIKNEDITVPNSTVLSSSTVNYSSQTKNESQGLIIHYTVTIGYDVPWQQIYQLLIEAALKTAHIETEPKPFVLQTSLDDYFISYQINAFTKEANKQAVIYSNLLENIQDVFNQNGIEIMSPSYHVVRDGGKEK
jgi:small-conductance mechanosensitive channel